jgi:hypothetical protein
MDAIAIPTAALIVMALVNYKDEISSSAVMTQRESNIPFSVQLTSSLPSQQSSSPLHFHDSRMQAVVL